MQIIDTFSGIGGFSLAGRWMGWQTVQFCEIDNFCQKVLKYYWPNVPIHDDIKTLTSDIIKNNGLYDPNETTIFTAGVPCQPWSTAGKRKGKTDDRNLWPQTIKLIGEFKPDWAVLENVFGLINWDGGLVFEQVQADLETEGYEVQPYVLPACAVGAPHRRDRVWFIAPRQGIRCDLRQAVDGREEQEFKDGEELWNIFKSDGNGGVSADTGSIGSERYATNKQTSQIIRQGRKSITQVRHNGYIASWDNFPTQSPLRSRDDGLSSRLAGITVSKHRNESIKSYGNAIVPQVALQIFKAIEQYEKL